MKKTLLIILFILSSFAGFSQSWINPGATWYYRWTYMFGMVGNDRIEYTHDTVIMGKTCQVLRTTESVYGLSGPMGTPPLTLWSTEILPDNYTYNNGDTVFYLVDSAHQNGNTFGFNVLYNFGAVAGDKWNLGIDSTLFCGTAASIVNVDSTSSMTIGTSMRRVIYTHDSTYSPVGLDPRPETGIHRSVIIEGIGCMYSFFPITRNCYVNGYLDGYYTFFSCFSDGITNYSTAASGECENPFHVGIDDDAIENENFIIYPNPAADVLTVKVGNAGYYSLSICNILGEKMLEQKFANTAAEIKIADLPSGIYMLSLKDEQGITTLKRFVKK